MALKIFTRALWIGVGMGLAWCWSAANTMTSPAVLLPKSALPRTTRETQSALTQEKMETPRWRGLDANLYMQSSAEYRACCLQAFAWAAANCQQKLKTMPEGRRPPAVILDLDETVLDNGGFQADQIRAGWAFDPERWKTWESEGGPRVNLIPGALSFIQQLRQWGIQPVYVTNRNQQSHAQTMAILKRFGIDVPDDLLLCADAATGSNKTSRRQKIQERFEVLVHIGDNLRDFDEQFRFPPQADEQSLLQRKQQVDQAADMLGSVWIILPNPAYGEWNKPLTGGEGDVRWLQPPATGASD